MNRKLKLLAIAIVISWLPPVGGQDVSRPVQQGFFPRPTSYSSASAFNSGFAALLADGASGIENALDGFLESGRLSGRDLTSFRDRIQEDIFYLASRDELLTAIVDWSTTAGREVHRMRRTLESASADKQAQARENLRQMELELAIAEAAVNRPVAMSKHLEGLRERVNEWIRLFESTERVTGIEAARRQVQPLMAAEVERWRGLARLELASVLRMRNYEIPAETPAALRTRFQSVLRDLPLVTREPTLQPNMIAPLVTPLPSALTWEMSASALADIRFRIRSSDGTSVELAVAQQSGNTYRAQWSPEFLSDTRWQRRLRRNPELSLGEWILEWELASTGIMPGERFVTQTGTVAVAASATAPKGTELEDEPRPPRILRRYASERDIPLRDRHHIFSFIYYPLLGLPRDAIDAVFGTVDKVPYVSIPINFVYAAPGRLICKPWWSDDYTPFAEQSAGFLSWNEWKTGGEWEYFENARTWGWPDDPFAAFISGIFYIPLGLPRDIVDIPFGWLDQIPYVTMPVSYAYQPVTLVTKPWYAERYTAGMKKGRPRVPYKDQSKNVIGLTDWWERSNWVFFENFKTTTFRSANHDRQSRERARYRETAAQHRQALSAHEARNTAIAGTYVVSFRTSDPNHNEHLE